MYSLFFSFQDGGCSVARRTTARVTVSSELAIPIQCQAVRVMGFDESHTSILESRGVAAQLNAILHRSRMARP